MKSQRAFASPVADPGSTRPDDLARYRLPSAEIADLLPDTHPRRERARSCLIRAGRAAWRACATAVATMRLWRERAESRKRLADLDPRMLRDIGVSRLVVWRESAKPFWHD